ncbi:MAG: hypothetical protein F6K35_35970, partial [Okeania sp. SIO2H7]|nr:hypothetical protein [Okeania sp. SIO2H7]
SEVKKAYPNFPDISFANYVRMMDSFFFRKKTLMELGNIENYPGWQTTRFIWFYFKRPLECLSSPLSEKYFGSEKCQEDMFPVRFLKTENLNQDLYDFLIEVGYKQNEIKFILERKKVLPPSPTGEGSRKAKWEEYYTPELKNFVRKREKFLFFLFPDYDVQKK